MAGAGKPASRGRGFLPISDPRAAIPDPEVNPGKNRSRCDGPVHEPIARTQDSGPDRCRFLHSSTGVANRQDPRPGSGTRAAPDEALKLEPRSWAEPRARRPTHME